VPIVGSIFALVTIATAKLPFDIDVTNAPIDSLVVGIHITFQSIAAFLFIATILTNSAWWLDRDSTNQQLVENQILKKDINK